MPPAKAVSVLVVVDQHAVSAFVPAVAAAFRDQCKAEVWVRVEPTMSSEGSRSLHTLLSLEKMIARRGRPSWSDRLERSHLEGLLETQTRTKPDFVIDLTAKAQEHDAVVLTPLFNGAQGEEALASALFFSGTPLIEIVVRRPKRDACVVLQGAASLEGAAGIGGAMEAVWSRTLMLLVKAMRLEQKGTEELQVEAPKPPPFRVLGTADIVRHSTNMLACAAASAAYRLCCYRPHWRIGWRFTDADGDVWSRRDLGGKTWSVLKDPIDHFYADPFPVSWQGRDYMLFEDLDHKTQKGIISAVEFGADGRPGPVRPVLEEPWHLSYPFVIAAEGEIWMIPEASLSGEIPIYRAVNFPWQWERHSALVTDVEAADATIVAHAGRLWMFAVTRQAVGGYSDALSIWTSSDLLGSWMPLACNPVLVDDQSARPAGALVVRNGELLRPVQDCRKGYGAALSLARVTKLDETGFEQVIETRLAPERVWPGRKLHTLNGNGRIEAIDGGIIRPKWGLLADVVDRMYRPGP